MILAETAPTGLQWNGFLVVCSFLAFFAANLATIWAVTRKQKREVHFGFEPASKTEFSDHVSKNSSDHKDLWSKIGGVERGANERLVVELRGLRDERRDDATTLQSKLDVFQRSIGALEAATNLQNQALAQIQADLRRHK